MHPLQCLCCFVLSYLLFGTLWKTSQSCLPWSSLWSLTALNNSWQIAICEGGSARYFTTPRYAVVYKCARQAKKFPHRFKVSGMQFTTNATEVTMSTGGTLEILLLFRPLPGVEEVSSRSPPPLTLLDGEVALLLLADIA